MAGKRKRSFPAVVADPPWTGPVRGPGPENLIAVGPNPGRGAPLCIVQIDLPPQGTPQEATALRSKRRKLPLHWTKRARLQIGDQPGSGLIVCRLDPKQPAADAQTLILVVHSQSASIGPAAQAGGDSDGHSGGVPIAAPSAPDPYRSYSVLEFADLLARGGDATRDCGDSVVPRGYTCKEWSTSIIRAIHRAVRDGDARALRCAAIPQTVRSSDRLSFALASCHYPAGIVDGTPAAAAFTLLGPSDKSYMRLADRINDLAGDERPTALILAGDQVYVDETAGLFDPTIGDEPFRIGYERWLTSVGARSVLPRVPVHMVIDDHEIVDNWAPEPPEALPDRRPLRPVLNSEQKLRTGCDAYERFQRRVWPTIGSGLWREDKIDGVPFFFADTRTERDRRTAASVANAAIMSETQMLALLGFLDRNRNHLCFVVSPSILLPRRRVALGPLGTRAFGPSAIQSDAWDGYPASLCRVLATLCESGAGNVIFLSGDEHMPCVSCCTIRHESGRTVTVRSIHSSGLYAPYPFANSVPETLVGNEAFDFYYPDAVGEQHYRCQVTTEFPGSGDCFAIVSVSQQNNASDVEVLFDGARGKRRYGSVGNGCWRRI